MIDAMPRPKWPHLHHEETRHGTLVWYVRIGHGKRTRIKATYGTPEFTREYKSAIDGEPVHKAGVGSLSWLIDQYRHSAAFASLAAQTRRQRGDVFRAAVKKAGGMSAKAITRQGILKALDERRGTPAMAGAWLKAMRGLFAWAVEQEHLKADPTLGVKAPKTKRTEGHHTWTEAEITRFCHRWKLGTRERLAFDVLLSTGLRRGDAVIFGRQHLTPGGFSLRTQKTGELVTAPIAKLLLDSIAAAKPRGLTFIEKEDGTPYSVQGFANWFRGVCHATGVPGSPHGLRKAYASMLAERGATEKQLDAVFGWSGGRMASLYTRKAEREKLARGAAALLENDTTTSIPAPLVPVRESHNKKRVKSNG